MFPPGLFTRKNSNAWAARFKGQEAVKAHNKHYGPR